MDISPRRGSRQSQLSWREPRRLATGCRLLRARNTCTCSIPTQGAGSNQSRQKSLKLVLPVRQPASSVSFPKFVISCKRRNRGASAFVSVACFILPLLPRAASAGRGAEHRPDSWKSLFLRVIRIVGLHAAAIRRWGWVRNADVRAAGYTCSFDEPRGD